GLNPPSDEGWLQVESTAPLAGVALILSGASVTAVPLQAAASDRILFARTAKGLSTEFTLVGDAEKSADIRIALMRTDGTTAALSDTITLLPHARISSNISRFVSLATFDDGFVTIRSTVPVFSVEMLKMANGRATAVVTPQRSFGFVPAPLTAALPVIT